MRNPSSMNRPLALVAALLLIGACATTTTTTRTWGAPQADWVRYGRVEQVSETVTRQEGNPVAGAALGAVVGGLFGSAIAGHGHYDRFGYYRHHGSGAGALVGAVGGAAVGAAASQGSGEQRSYAVSVRFDDGGRETYGYRDFSPFQVGDTVALSARGIQRVRAGASSPPPRAPAPPPPPRAAPAPEPAPPPAASVAPQTPAPGTEGEAQPSYPAPSAGPTLPPPDSPWGESGPPPDVGDAPAP